MQTPTTSDLAKYLTDDILLIIFNHVSLVHRRRLSQVCERWRRLIELTMLWTTTFSAVDDRRCVTDWEPAKWLSLKYVNKKDYIRVAKASASELLCALAPQMPNIQAINLECCDMNTRILRTILRHCKKVSRLNLDSSTKLNYYSFNLITREWSQLRHLNVSCCTEVSELSAQLIITNLTQLESLNLCGTKITGRCLKDLSERMKRLDISYCWSIQEDGLMALSQAKSESLVELIVNNFDFDGSESCFVALCNTFKQLKHLQMSIGPCVNQDYFIDRLTGRGFAAIAQMRNLETLIIEKVCVLDNTSLLTIMKSCSKLRRLHLHLGWLNMCTDLAFSNIDAHLPQLETLHIAYAASLTTKGLTRLSFLRKLNSLSIINASIDNDIFKVVEPLQSLTSINFDECRKITLRGLNSYCRYVEKRPNVVFKISLQGTGITISRLKLKRNFPRNLQGVASNFRASKHNCILPPVMNL